MPNYRETSLTGTSWQRAKRIILENPLGGIPSATFIEEKVIVDGSNIVKIPYEGPVLSDQMTDPNVSFNLLNPEEDTVVGTMTYAEYYAVNYSLHRHLAAIRDANP